MIVSVPESVGVIECLRTTFKDAFNAVGLQGYSFPKGVVNGAVTDIPIIAEPALKWERRFRVKTDPGCGAIHLYSSTTASFEQVIMHPSCLFAPRFICPFAQVVGAVSEFMPPFVPSYTQ